VVGAALGASGIVLRPRADAMPDDAIAVVGDAVVLRADYDREFASLQAQGRPVDEAARRRLIDRLVDEELLVRYGVELGLVDSDPRVRTDLSAAVLALVRERAEEHATDPGEDELRVFYAEHQAEFAASARYVVERVFVASADGAEARAQALLSSWRAAPDQVPDGDPPTVPLPAGPLGLADLCAALGPTSARTVSELSPGEFAGPLRVQRGFSLLHLRDVERVTRGFDDVRPLVRDELRRRAAEHALSELLEQRRAATRVVLREPQ